MLHFYQILVLKDNYVTLIHDDETRQTAVVDAGEAEPILAACHQKGWQLSSIWITHHHGDHLAGAEALRQQTGAQIYGFAQDAHRLPSLDMALDETGFHFGRHRVEVMHLQGHTDGHIAYYLPQQGRLFCGDVMFLMGCGRLFEGTPAEMFASLQRIKALPPETLIHCGHEYTAHNARFAHEVLPDNAAIAKRLDEITSQPVTVPASLTIELQTNPFLLAETLEAFTQLRKQRDGW